MFWVNTTKNLQVPARKDLQRSSSPSSRNSFTCFFDRLKNASFPAQLLVVVRENSAITCSGWFGEKLLESTILDVSSAHFKTFSKHLAITPRSYASQEPKEKSKPPISRTRKRGWWKLGDWDQTRYFSLPSSLPFTLLLFSFTQSSSKITKALASPCQDR